MSELLFGTLLLSSSPATSLATVTDVPVISHGRNIIKGSYLFRIGFAILNRFLQILLQILHMLAIYFILLWVKSALTEKQLKKKKQGSSPPLPIVNKDAVDIRVCCVRTSVSPLRFMSMSEMRKHSTVC